MISTLLVEMIPRKTFPATLSMSELASATAYSSFAYKASADLNSSSFI